MKYKDTIIEGLTQGDHSSFELMFATEFEEFYYEDGNNVVPEGHPVGFDVDTDEGVELVLFDHIYWNPPYGEEEND